MKAIRLLKPGTFEPISLPEPTGPALGEALVQVHRVGICGTDISGYLGRMPFFSYPRIIGHELGVEVLEVGPDVTNVRPGDRCSVEPYINCQTCFACRRGGINCCENLQVLGVHTDGGLRPRFLVPARKLHPSKMLTFEQLALVETLGIGCHAVARGAPQRGEHVLVIGAGPIGLSVIEFVKLAGPVVTVADVQERRLAFCKDTLRVDHTVQFVNDGSDLKQLQEITDGALFTVVFDATGNADSMAFALHCAAHTGKIVYVGITSQDVRVPDALIHRREITLFASRNALPDDFTRIIRLIEESQIDTRPWVTHRSAFSSMIADFSSYTRPETGVIKAIVEID